jgi:hypothetical protein
LTIMDDQIKMKLVWCCFASSLSVVLTITIATIKEKLTNFSCLFFFWFFHI